MHDPVLIKSKELKAVTTVETVVRSRRQRAQMVQKELNGRLMREVVKFE